MESYVECLVRQKTPAVKVLLKFLFPVLTVLFLFASLLVGLPGFIMAVVCGVLSYFMRLEASVEYEYLYANKEIGIDKIRAKQKRKNVEKIEIEKIEILAPVKSWHLDEYRNRNLKQKDYSIGYETQPDERYVLICDNGEKLLLSPSPAFIDAIRSVAPRKVFTD